MAKFTTRVELHDADWSDYTNLHAAMKRQGFSQTIESDEGKVYELPPAEYGSGANSDASGISRSGRIDGA